MFLITESDFFNFAIILYHSFNSISSYQAWSSYTVKEKRLKELDSIFNNLFNFLNIFMRNRAVQKIIQCIFRD